MLQKFLAFFRSRPVSRGPTHIENLISHPEVSLSPVATTDPPLNLPVWFASEPDCEKPATYDGVFWEIEPTGEYLFYLAGDYAKNEKGLLRFRTAPVEIRAELSFEPDVISVARHDGQIEQQQASETAADVSDVSGLTVSEAAGALLEAAQALGYERWIIPNRHHARDHKERQSRLALGLHWITKEPYVELTDQTFYALPEDAPSGSVFTVTTWCGDPGQTIGDLVAAHDQIAQKYQTMPGVRLSGATRL